MPGENSINRDHLVERIGSMAWRLNPAQTEALAVALEKREPCTRLIDDLTRAQRAMIAARLANRGKGRHRGAAPPGLTLDIATAERVFSVNETMIHAAKRVLRSGPAQHIEAIERGHAGVHHIARKLAPVRQPKPNPDSFVWKTFRHALTNLTALPDPAECVTVVRHTDRHAFTPKHLDRAHAWLTAFIEAYHANKDKAA